MTENGKEIIYVSRPAELAKFINKNWGRIKLTRREAGLILGYAGEHDFVVGARGSELYLGFLSGIPGGLDWDEISLEDLISVVCEWNYATMRTLDRKAQDSTGVMKRMKSWQKEYRRLKRDELVLERLYGLTN